MTLWYNEPKDSKFATIGGIDWENINSNLEFDELRYCSDDEWFYLFLHATKFTDVNKMGEKDFKFQPQLVMLQVMKAESAKVYDFKQKKQVDRSQSFVEKLVCHALKECEPEKAYKGFIVLQKSGAIELAVSGKDGSGQEMPELVRNQLLATAFSLAETDTELVPADDVKVKEKKAWSGGSKGQTEKEKMDDRLSWLIAAIKPVAPDFEMTTFADVIQCMNSNPKAKEIADWFSLIIK